MLFATHACIERMNLHEDPLPDLSALSQYWRGSITITQLHEKRPIKRAGVAGIRLRAMDLMTVTIWMDCDIYRVNEIIYP